MKLQSTAGQQASTLAPSKPVSGWNTPSTSPPVASTPLMPVLRHWVRAATSMSPSTATPEPAGSMTIPNTNGWGSWQTISPATASTVTLLAGAPLYPRLVRLQRHHQLCRKSQLDQTCGYVDCGNRCDEAASDERNNQCSCRKPPSELVAAVILQEGGQGQFYVNGSPYNPSFYKSAEGPWAQPYNNSDGIMQVTSSSGYKVGPYTEDQQGYDNAIRDGGAYLNANYSTYE